VAKCRVVIEGEQTDVEMPDGYTDDELDAYTAGLVAGVTLGVGRSSGVDLRVTAWSRKDREQGWQNQS